MYIYYIKKKVEVPNFTPEFPEFLQEFPDFLQEFPEFPEEFPEFPEIPEFLKILMKKFFYKFLKVVKMIEN